MNYFLYRLIPPRPSFARDMTEAEGTIMQAHFAYWLSLLEQGKVVVVGPVLDPKGTYGIAVLEVEDEALAENLAENDPAITSKAGFSFELHSMIDAKVRQ
jgi:uncharacterized protein